MSVYHAGSRAVQDLLGVRDRADHVGRSLGQDIQRRETYEWAADREPGRPERLSRLGAEQVEFIESADTFFLATVHDHGADVSHRGGNPGFVQVTSPRHLTWRDYPGNSMFLTL